MKINVNFVFNKPSRDFLARFSRGFRQVFVKLSSFFLFFLCFWMRSDTLGRVWIRSDAFGHVGKRSDAFGRFWKILENSTKIFVFCDFGEVLEKRDAN